MYLPGEQGLVETERSHLADPIRMVNKLLANRDDSVHHGVPTTAELVSEPR
ncbi:MAG: hypothetical protein V9G12_17985 [Microthrixaceae bacterium]